MKKILFLYFFALVIFNFKSAYGAQLKLTANPMKSAEAQSLFYSEGDTGNSSGWSGCSTLQVTTRKIEIACQGFATVLVHGGHAARKNFLCHYIFEARSVNQFLVRYERCQ